MLFVAFYMPNSTELKPTFNHTIASFLYIPTSSIFPVLAVGWTLNYEMYFYLIFGLVLFLQGKYQIPVLAAWLSGSVILGSFYHGDNALINQTTNPLLIEFLLGVIVARLFLAGKIWSVTQALTKFH